MSQSNSSSAFDHSVVISQTAGLLVSPRDIEKSITFILETFQKTGKNQAVIAASGGIDSAVALSLLVRALGREQVTALLLPFGNQDMADARLICDHQQLSSSQILTFNIEPLVQAAAQTTGLALSAPTPALDKVRLGNLMARARMMLVFDTAKSRDALVCGTENKSEHYLGYFTRFGDAASDLEPLAMWYKTQVRLAAQLLELPPRFLVKAPSAGLWAGQSDEEELGFSYEQADQILVKAEATGDVSKLIEGKVTIDSTLERIQPKDPQVARQVLQQVTKMSFKLQVPYQIESHA